MESPDSPAAYQFGEYVFDRTAFRVIRGDVPVHLEPKAVDVLAFLLDHPGHLVSKQELMQAVWKDTAVGDNALTRVVAQLRKALEDPADRPRYIETVPTRGYRFVAPTLRVVAGRVADLQTPGAALRNVPGAAADSISWARPAPGDLLGSYEVLEPLGSGGMGEVYRARDRRLGRDVAIKVLPAESVSDTRRRARFNREARAISALNHPNIVTIHDIDSVDGTHFIVMELVPGETLAQRLRRGALSPRDALTIGIPLAEGLAAAHAAGIVHRDLKPANVMLRPDGVVKVLDFGLAKIADREASGSETASAGDAGADPKASRTGMVVGTTGYMSPEQASGRLVDARSDIFSFGILLYEMATGERPFRGTSAATSGFDDATAGPPLRGAVPVALERLIVRCLRRDPAQRFQFIADVKVELQEIAAAFQSGESHATPERSRRPLSRRWLVALAAILVITIAAAALWLTGRARPAASTVRISRVAVLPFTNLHPDSGQAYVAEGVTQAVTDTLSQFGALTVISTTSSRRYRDATLPSSVIASELGVEALFEGAVMRSGTRLRVSVAMVDGPSGQRLWTRSYERDTADALAIYDDIAASLAAERTLIVEGTRAARTGPPRTVVPEAYDDYLRALHLLGNRWMSGGARAAEPLLLRAVERDPSLAQAHAALAWCYAYPDRVGRPVEDTGPRAKAAVARALALDDHLALAHAVAGTIKWRLDYDLPGAWRELQRAYDLDPNSGLVLIPVAEFSLWHGDPERGFPLLERAVALDPFSPDRHAGVGFSLVMAGRYDEAIAAFRKAIELEPPYPSAQLWLAESYAYRGDRGAAVAEYLTWLDSAILPGRAAEAGAALRRAYDTGGWQAFWREEAKYAEEENAKPGSLWVPAFSRYTGPWHMARRYARLEQWDRALDALDRACERRSHLMPTLLVDPLFVPLHAHPRFRELARRTGVADRFAEPAIARK